MIARYVNDEKSLSVVAKEAGCAISTVHRRLNRAGIPLREATMPCGTRTIKVSDEALAETIRLYQEGFSIEEVGRLLHLSPSAVHYRLTKMAGLKLRGPHGQIFGHRRLLPSQEFERVAQLYKLGLSSTEIAESLGISSHAVLWRLKVAGVPMRSRKESLKLRWARRPRNRVKT
jgi:DNA-directed RNA polymerase specialized sigma24 family protein